MNRTQPALTAAAVLGCLLAGLAAVGAAGPQSVVPVNGSYFGVSFDFELDTVASYTERLGFDPAVYNIFLPLPLGDNATVYLADVLPQIADKQAIALLTVMPTAGLDTVTRTAAAELAYHIRLAQEVRGQPHAQHPAPAGRGGGRLSSARAGWRQRHGPLRPRDERCAALRGCPCCRTQPSGADAPARAQATGAPSADRAGPSTASCCSSCCRSLQRSPWRLPPGAEPGILHRYIWGQQPLAFVAAWKLVHKTLADLACGVNMVWAPNTAIGSPWRVNDQSTTQCAPAPVPAVALAAAGLSRAGMGWSPHRARRTLSGCLSRHRYGARPGTADFHALDTNDDGHVNSKDDPFAPYYPGAALRARCSSVLRLRPHLAATQHAARCSAAALQAAACSRAERWRCCARPGDEYVEWVGMSVDHFGGSARPFDTNERPAAREFAHTVRCLGPLLPQGACCAGPPPPRLGRHDAPAADPQITGVIGHVPNFYNTYSGDRVHAKPMCIAETTAMYIPGVCSAGQRTCELPSRGRQSERVAWGAGIESGDTNFTIKSKWWEQVGRLLTQRRSPGWGGALSPSCMRAGIQRGRRQCGSPGHERTLPQHQDGPLVGALSGLSGTARWQWARPTCTGLTSTSTRRT